MSYFSPQLSAVEVSAVTPVSALLPLISSSHCVGNLSISAFCGGLHHDPFGLSSLSPPAYSWHHICFLISHCGPRLDTTPQPPSFMHPSEHFLCHLSCACSQSRSPLRTTFVVYSPGATINLVEWLHFLHSTVETHCSVSWPIFSFDWCHLQMRTCTQSAVRCTWYTEYCRCETP